MKLLLIIPRYLHSSGKPIIPHPGIAQLSAVLTEQSVEHHIIDSHLYDWASISEKIKKINPTLIGITIYSPGYRLAYQLIEKIKSNFDILIVVGGPHVSVIRNDSLMYSLADFAVKHEGEKTLVELIDTIRNNGDFSKIDGLIWRDKDNEIIENIDRSFLNNKELGELPFPDYNKFEIEKYLCYEEKLLPLITSRGCPYLCTYCSVKLTQGRKFRALSPKRSIDEIKQRVAEGWTTFEVHDDCFSLDLDRAKEFCDLLIKENLNIKYKFNGGIRADRTDKELLAKLSKSGCEFIAYGLESADPEVLYNIKKRINTQKVKEVLQETHKVGINTAVNFIIGLPGENYQKALETIKFAKSLKNSMINMANVIPFSGTELYEWVKSNGTFLFIPEIYLNSISFNDKVPVFETVEFPKSLRIKALKKGFRLSRKRDLQQKLGKLLGAIVMILYQFDTLRKIIDNIFKGTKIGRKFYIKLFKIKHQ